MPAPKLPDDGFPTEPADVAEAPVSTKRYIVSRNFTGRHHTQLLRFAVGDELEAPVGEYMVATGAPVKVIEGD